MKRSFNPPPILGSWAVEVTGVHIPAKSQSKHLHASLSTSHFTLPFGGWHISTPRPVISSPSDGLSPVPQCWLRMLGKRCVNVCVVGLFIHR